MKRLLILISALTIVSCRSAQILSRNPAASNPAHSASEFLNCSEEIVADNGLTSPNLSYFQGLMKKGQQAELEDFLKLWHPEVGDGSKLDSPFFLCERSTEEGFAYPYAAPIPNESIGIRSVPENCHPDLLFSWGSSEKAVSILNRLNDRELWNGPINKYSNAIRPGEIDSSISPVSTFGFGKVLLRFKIKPSAPFEFYAYDGDPDQIVVLTGSWHDFQFRNSALIESVSYGTPEIYDEIVRDILRFKSSRRAHVYSSRVMDNFKTGGAKGLDRVFTQNVDHHDQSEKALKLNLLELIREILAGEGQIHISANACRNRSEVYSTSNPTYIEPRLSRYQSL